MMSVGDALDLLLYIASLADGKKEMLMDFPASPEKEKLLGEYCEIINSASVLTAALKTGLVEL